ncbi:MAG: hypothetical protein IJW12_04575 [Opitutales bacterium]|nr:hypothetical protein [Opitutales bacterium]
MYLFFKRALPVASLAAICLGAGTGTLAALNALAQERENPGMLISRSGLFRKIPGDNALFLKENLSPENRRAVLMLTCEPRNKKELDEARETLNRFSEILPEGNFLFLIDDTGSILLQREIPKTRKIFELADELRILHARLKSIPVAYFPTDSLRGKIRTDIFEGNSEFPVPAKNGGTR